MATRGSGRGRGRTGRRPRRAALSLRTKLLAIVFAGGIGGVLAYGFHLSNSDVPTTYSSIVDHVKYGSTGAERTFGIPYAVFRALPKVCGEHLPDAEAGYASLGFIYERGRDLPVGFSQRYYRGLDLVGLNCGACHVGQVQDPTDSDARIYVGMPANTADVGGFLRFLTRCAIDEDFTPERILSEIDAEGIALGPIDRMRLLYTSIYELREDLLRLRDRLAFMDEHPDFGPGRIDTVTTTKAMFDLELGDRYERPIPTVDFAAVWLQGKKSGMDLYWDGSNDSMQERHLLGAVHTGAVGTADMDSVMRVRNLFEDEQPPPFPYGFNEKLATRGERIYRRYCSDCHGANGREFEGSRVGQVTPLRRVGTDPGRVRAYGEEVAARQRSLSPDGTVNLRRFKPTEGYANVPLDGIWLRAPYLHNGSVPTLRALLERSSKRPEVFYRGDWVYDPEAVGFVWNMKERDGRQLFPYYTALPGNSNRGHEGRAYGTELSPGDKDALIEYLKMF